MITKMITKRTLLILLALAAAIAIALYYYQPVGEKPIYTLRIIDPIEANNLHVPVADKMGFFRDQGISVAVSGTSAGKLAMDALNGNAVDYAVVVDMNVAQTLFEQDDIVILAELAEPITAIKLLGRRDKGIQRASDLVGKKIAVLFGVNIHLFLLRYLESEGIPVEKVQLVNLQPPVAVAAFEAGSVDAIITWQPHVYNLRQKLGEQAVILTEDDDAYWKYRILLVTRRSRWEQRRDEAQRVVRAIVAADDFIREQPDRAQEILANRLNLNVEAIRTFMGEIQFRVQVTKRLLEVLETDVGWLQDAFHNGRAPVTVDFRRLIADDLRTIRPTSWLLNHE